MDLEGKRLSEVLPRPQRAFLDAETELSFRRRAYIGRRAGDTARFRLVAVWDEGRWEYYTYLSNIGPETLSTEQVASLYRMRWEIELTFKELRGQYALGAFGSTKANAVVGIAVRPGYPVRSKSGSAVFDTHTEPSRSTGLDPGFH